MNITFPLLHGDCLTTAEAGRCNLLPCQASPKGFPLGGFCSPSSASRTKMALPSDMPDVIVTLVSYFCSLPGLARKACKHFFFFLISLFTLVVTIRPQVAFHCTPANSCFSLQFISTSAKSQHSFNYIHTIYIIDYIK